MQFQLKFHPTTRIHWTCKTKHNIQQILYKSGGFDIQVCMYVAAASAFLLFRHKTRLKPLVTSDNPILSGRFQNFVKLNRFSHILFKSVFQSNSHIFFENSTAALLFFLWVLVVFIVSFLVANELNLELFLLAKCKDALLFFQMILKNMLPHFFNRCRVKVT